MLKLLAEGKLQTKIIPGSKTQITTPNTELLLGSYPSNASNSFSRNDADNDDLENFEVCNMFINSFKYVCIF